MQPDGYLRTSLPSTQMPWTSSPTQSPLVTHASSSPLGPAIPTEVKYNMLATEIRSLPPSAAVMRVQELLVPIVSNAMRDNSVHVPAIMSVISTLPLHIQMRMCVDMHVAHNHITQAQVYQMQCFDSDKASEASTDGSKSSAATSSNSDDARKIDELSRALQESESALASRELELTHLRQNSVASASAAMPSVIPHLPLRLAAAQAAAQDVNLVTVLREMSATNAQLVEQMQIICTDKDHKSDFAQDTGKAERITFTKYKNAGDGPGKVRVEDIVWDWESNFLAAKIDPSVARVLGLMQPDGNIAEWAKAYKTTTGRHDDPEDIKNWTWARFKSEFLTCDLQVPIDKQKIRQDFKSIKCAEPGTLQQITEYTTAFAMGLQNLRKYGLYEVHYTEASIAQQLYDNLPPLVHLYLSHKNPNRIDPATRLSYQEVREELTQLKEFPAFKVALQDLAKQPRANVGIQDSVGNGRRKVEVRAGEVTKFSPVSSNALRWLEQNGKTFKIRHAPIRDDKYVVIVGLPASVDSMFSNAEARRCGLVPQTLPPWKRNPTASPPSAPVQAAPAAHAAAVPAAQVSPPMLPDASQAAQGQVPQLQPVTNVAQVGLQSQVGAMSSATLPETNDVEPQQVFSYSAQVPMHPSGGGRARPYFASYGNSGFLRPPPQPSTAAWEAGNAAENNAREDSPVDDVREKAAPDMPLHKGPSPPVREARTLDASERWRRDVTHAIQLRHVPRGPAAGKPAIIMHPTDATRGEFDRAVAATPEMKKSPVQQRIGKTTTSKMKHKHPSPSTRPVGGDWNTANYEATNSVLLTEITAQNARTVSEQDSELPQQPSRPSAQRRITSVTRVGAGITAIGIIATLMSVKALIPQVKPAKVYRSRRMRSMACLFILAFLVSISSFAFMTAVTMHTSDVASLCIDAMLTSTQTFIAVGAANRVFDKSVHKMQGLCDSSVDVLRDVVFPKGREKFKYKSRLHVNPAPLRVLGSLGRDAHVHTPATYRLSTHIAMPGVSDDSMLDATHVCLSLNFAPEGTKVFLVDSGANAPIMKETADVRDHIENYDISGGIKGQGVQSSFTTEASGNIGITIPAVAEDGKGFLFDMLIQGAQFAKSVTVDLLPVAFFQRQGCDVIYRGRKSVSDPSPAGEAEIRLYEFVGTSSRRYKGSVWLQYWQDLWFFTYTTFRPVRDHIVAAAMHASALTKHALTNKAHVIFGHGSGRRVHNMYAQHGRGAEIYADLQCSCPICAETKTEMPSRRKFEQVHVHNTSARGDYWIPSDMSEEYLLDAMSHLRQMDASEDDLLPDLLPLPTHSALHFRAGVPSARRHSTRPRQYWHADTIPLGSKSWNNMKHALILVDDFSRMTFVYLLKEKTQHTVAAALQEHFDRQGLQEDASTDTSVNFYVRGTILRSDRGSEFINATVLALCRRLGCTPLYSSPGQQGKYQNGVVERRIKELGRISRSIMHTSGLPDQAASYCVLQAVDILNALPSTANSATDGIDVTGFAPYYAYYGSLPDIDDFYSFGAYTSVHLDPDHTRADDRHNTAATCVYLCKAHHFQSKGHVVWDYVKRRKLIVPSLSKHVFNYFPMRATGHHLSDHLTFVDAKIDDPDIAQAQVTKIDPSDEIDPTSKDFPDSQVVLDDAERDDGAATYVVRSAYKTRQYERMRLNIGTRVRRVFFINGANGPTDYFEGVVRSITPENKYDIAYADNDSEEFSEKDFERYRLSPQEQKMAHLAKFGGDKLRLNHFACNCAQDHCYHPWAQSTPGFSSSDLKNGTTMFARSAGMRTRSGDRRMPSNKVPYAVEYHAAAMCAHVMPDVVTNQDPIQSMTSYASMIGARSKATKMSAYKPDPMTVDECKKSPEWEVAREGNSWKEAILNEIGNLRKYNVFDIIKLEDVPSGAQIFQIIINFLTKRTKDSTPDCECIDKRKCRICFGGHHMTAGVHYAKPDSYAPVPSWTTIKLQLALTSKHKMQLRAFDCTAAYLQADLKDPLYVRPPKGLMEEMGQNKDDIWKLKKSLYGISYASRNWWEKVSKWLKAYGFRTLGNSGTFLMLDRRDAKDAGKRGIILLNLYSDDGLASINNSALWDVFMADFKRDFDVLEKDPDYFLGCTIEWDEKTSVISLDPSKYLREVAAKFDMLDAYPSPIPLPAGAKVYMNETWDGNENNRSLYQQMCGCCNYAALLRPDLMYSVSQICRVMSCPNEENIAQARNVIKYMIGSMDEKLTFRPTDPSDPYGDYNCNLMMFSDSDWATSVDTRRSHGSYVIMMAGAAIAHRSKSHKSVMLSSAAAEYYEASESCRELAYIRGILEDFYGEPLPPTPLYIDNAACISMGNLPVFSERQKHIPIRVAHLKECTAERMVELKPVSTKFELADIGTKALPSPAFVMLRDVILGKVSFSSVQGF